MATTTNFGWETPDDTDLVKDGALAMRTLGNAIDASLLDLKGGTTGQVLSKTSNTDMDFTWVTSDDANAIQNAIVDAKGDLIAATAADTPARLAVGNNGETLVADSSASTGLRWQGNYSAGKNAIINGDFRIWQRGTSFSNPADGAYTADRWAAYGNGSGATKTVSQQTFTPGSAPVAGYEGSFFFRFAQSVAGTGATYNGFRQRIEDVRTFAGQTVTVSFWAKADAARTLTVGGIQGFGSGGSGDVGLPTFANTLTTSWVRYSGTIAVPSISGKTIGTSSFLAVNFDIANNTAQTIDIWGVQVEAGNVATAFQTATGTLAGELAACQRYYFRTTAGTAYGTVANYGFAKSATEGTFSISAPVTMRVAPTSVDFANIAFVNYADTVYGLTSVTLNANNNAQNIVGAGTISGATTGHTGRITGNNNTAGFLGFSAEL